MALGYRSILRLEDDADALHTANEQMRDWLVSKFRNARTEVDQIGWDAQGKFDIGPHAGLTIVDHSGEDGSRRRLLRFVEENSAGVWRVAVTAHSVPHVRHASQVVLVEVDNDTVGDDLPASERTDPPRIVRQLLDTVDVRDYHSDLVLRARPEVVSPEDVHDLLEVLQDESRNTSVVIAGALPGAPLETWIGLVEKLLRKSAGTTTAFVLTQETSDALNELLGATHRVDHGAVRTFLPGARPGDEEDAVRHRILTARTFAEAIGERQRVRASLLKVHAASSRRRLLDQPLPKDLLRTVRVLERAELDDFSLPETVPTPPSVPAAEPSEQRKPVPSPEVTPLETESEGWLRALRNLLASAIGVSELSEQNVGRLGRLFESLRNKVTQNQGSAQDVLTRLHAVSDENQHLRKQLEELELDLAISEGQRREAARLAGFRGDQLKELQEYSRLFDADSGHLDQPPASISDLLDRLVTETELSPYVEFTGDLDYSLALESYDVVGRYAEAFWEYILVLRDYCKGKESGNFSGNIYMYLTDDQARGRKCDPKRFAATESDSVQQNSAWRNEREFPVPQSVDPSGRIYMFAHFKPTHSDTVAPRMHIYDDVHQSGKIYIGYIGRHLTNTRSN